MVRDLGFAGQTKVESLGGFDQKRIIHDESSIWQSLLR